MRSLITSRFDYGNATLYGITQGELNRLQKLQNRAARLVFSASRSETASVLISQLHWLPIRERILFKFLLYVYKCCHDCAPSYLSGLLTFYAPGRAGLRSSSDKFRLSEPNRIKSVGSRSFSVAGPKEWNKLPRAIRESPSISVFKKKLKTHLFTLSQG